MQEPEYQAELMQEPGYQIELINLGRCLQDPAVLNEFTPDDWLTESHRELFIDLTASAAIGHKRQKLADYLKRHGVDPRWIEDGITAGKACTESQKVNVLEQRIATHALYLCEDLRDRRTMGRKDRILYHLEELKRMVTGDAADTVADASP